METQMTHDISIRTERPADIEAISRITELAFQANPHSHGTEQFIINELRRQDALTISLVADADGQVVGHIAFSPVEFSDGSRNWYGLGPVSVIPELQGQGIGRALVEAGLAELRTLGAEGCVLVGEPAFYGRFGFSTRPDCTMEGVPQQYVLSLTFGQRPATGNIIHHAAFGARE
jgi:putative acetyltransferase